MARRSLAKAAAVYDAIRRLQTFIKGLGRAAASRSLVNVNLRSTD